MSLIQDLLKKPSFIEAHLYDYLLQKFCHGNDANEFRLQKTLKVEAPFGNISKRVDGVSQIVPEICAVSRQVGFVAEAAAWDDDAYGSSQSEAHVYMKNIGLEANQVYHAQKIVCQVLPAFIYTESESKDCYSFVSVTQNHQAKMENVLDRLKNLGFLQGYSRPLEENIQDVQKYYQVIYEIYFNDPQKIKRTIQGCSN